jgi:hypothetical protein
MQEVSSDQLLEKLTEILETWPLYREFVYTGAANGFRIPEKIQLLCASCGTKQPWRPQLVHGENNRNGFSQKLYNCSCNRQNIQFYFYWKAEGQSYRFFKVGQHPPLDESINSELEKMLDEQDLKFYRNAIRLRNFNLGLGAVAYMRRVVENRMNDILDLVHELAVQDSWGTNLMAQFEDIRKDPRFSTKVEYAAKLIPLRLYPEGLPNPIGILHALTSDGLHARSEDECVDIFDRCKLVFEYLFANLRPSIADAKAFRLALTALTQKQATKAGPSPNESDVKTLTAE